MKTLRLEIEMTYDDDITHGDNAEAIKWFNDNVILHPLKDGKLVLYSYEIGDEVGDVKVLKMKAKKEKKRIVKSRLNKMKAGEAAYYYDDDGSERNEMDGDY